MNIQGVQMLLASYSKPAYLRQSNMKPVHKVPIQLSEQLNYLQWNRSTGQRDKVKS